MSPDRARATPPKAGCSRTAQSHSSRSAPSSIVRAACSAVHDIIRSQGRGGERLDFVVAVPLTYQTTSVLCSSHVSDRRRSSDRSDHPPPWGSGRLDPDGRDRDRVDHPSRLDGLGPQLTIAGLERGRGLSALRSPATRGHRTRRLAVAGPLIPNRRVVDPNLPRRRVRRSSSGCAS